MRALSTLALPALVLLSTALSTTLSAAAAPTGEATRPLIDGRVIDSHPVSAVGALLATADDGTAREGAFMCSAVLVTPTVALTAAHCVALVEADAAEEGWQLDWWISFSADVRGFDGPDPQLPPETIAVRPVVHRGFDGDRPIRSDRPDAAHDIAVLLLDAPAPVAPVPMARDAGQLADLTADAILLAGYGLPASTPDALPGERLAGPGRLFTIGPYELRVGRQLDADADAAGLAEKCGGDSGGPTFADTPDGWRVIGLTSRAHAADPGCAIAGFDTRVDAYAAWVDRVAAAPLDPPMACTARPGTPPPGGPAALLLLLIAVGLRKPVSRQR